MENFSAIQELTAAEIDLVSGGALPLVLVAAAGLVIAGLAVGICIGYSEAKAADTAKAEPGKK